MGGLRGSTNFVGHGRSDGQVVAAPESSPRLPRKWLAPPCRIASPSRKRDQKSPPGSPLSFRRLPRRANIRLHIARPRREAVYNIFPVRRPVCGESQIIFRTHRNRRTCPYLHVHGAIVAAIPYRNPSRVLRLLARSDAIRAHIAGILVWLRGRCGLTGSQYWHLVISPGGPHWSALFSPTGGGVARV
jgi:hypothetical protein